MLQRNRYNATDVIAPMMPIYQQLISGGHGLKILVREGATLEYPGVPRSTPEYPGVPLGGPPSPGRAVVVSCWQYLCTGYLRSTLSALTQCSH